MKKLLIVLIFLVSLFATAPTFAYTVKKGDTLSQIAQANGLTLAVLAELNPQIQDLNYIYVGQHIHTRMTDVKTADMKVEKSSQEEIKISEEEIDLLARIVRAEAQTEPFIGKVAVVDVIMNRVDDPQFPDTVEDVIYAPGQFQPVMNGEIQKPADKLSMEAVETAISNEEDVTNDSLFFYNPDIATNRWLDNKETTVVIGDHVFKK